MIANKIRGDILKSDFKHIVFAVNTEGYNDAGFAGLIARRFWPDLAITGEQKLGTVISKKSGEKTFHGIVCHSLSADGWKDSPRVIEEALNSLDIPEGEEIAAVAIGNGPIGLMQGADGEANLKAMEKSKHRITVYSL